MTIAYYLTLRQRHSAEWVCRMFPRCAAHLHAQAGTPQALRGEIEQNINPKFLWKGRRRTG